ncbi:MAG: gliding motility-associated-like protein [Flavobacteriales bacterium]|jgi:gliding motility-associated-like protein
MIKKILTLLICLYAGVNSFAQNVYNWQLAGLDTTIHNIVDFIELPDSNLIVTGTAFHTPGDTTKSDPFLIRMDKKGNIIWAKTYPGSVAETINSIVLSDNNQLIVSGTTHSFNNRIIFNEFNDYLGAVLYYFDLDGNILNAEAFQDNKMNTAANSLISKSNEIYLSGPITSNPTSSFLRKSSATGNVNTKFSTDGGSLELKKAVLVGDKWVGLFNSNAFYSNTQSVVASLSGSSSINWATALNINSISNSVDIIAVSNGYIVCSNNTLNGFSQTILVSKLNATGTLQWSYNFAVAGQKLTASSLLKVNSNEIHISGAINDGNINKPQTIVIDNNGSFQGFRTYSLNKANISNTIRGIDQSVFYVVSPDSANFINGYLIKNNQDNLYQCLRDESNLINASDVTGSLTALDVKSNIVAATFNLNQYQYEYNTPVIFSKDIFVDQQCFKCDVDADFTAINAADDCYKIDFIPNDSTLKEYSWDFGEIGGYSNAASPSYNYDMPGDYSVTLMAFNKCGMNSITKTITVDLKFLSDFDTVIDCYTVTATPKKEGINYLWVSHSQVYSTDPVFTHTYDNSGSYNIILTGSNSCVSERKGQVITIEDQSISPDFGITPTCQDYTFNIITPANINMVKWDFGDGTTDETDSFNVNKFYNPGTYEVSVEVANDCFIETSTKTIVVEDFTLYPSFTYTQDCNVLTFSQNTEHVNTILWKFGDGNTSAVANPSNNYGLGGGNFLVELEIADICGNIQTSSQNIVLLDLDVDPTFTSDLLCEEYSFQANEPIGNLTDVYWDFGDGIEAIGHTVNHTYSASGTYDVSMTAFNACDVATTIIPINYVKPLNQASFNFLNNCNSITFNNTSSTGALAYAWDYGNGTSSTNIDDVVVYTPGDYTVKLTVDFGCEIIVYTELLSLPEIDVNPDFSALLFCKDARFKLLDASNAASINWELGDGSFRNGLVNFNYTYAAAGNYNVKVFVTSNCGKLDSLIKTISILNVVNATAGPDVTICQGGNIELQATGGDETIWSPAGTVAPFDGDNPTAFPPVTTTYTVTVTDQNCTGTDSDQVTVTVIPRPTANISGKETICEGEFAQLPVAFTGIAPYTLFYNINGGALQSFGPTNDLNTFLPISEDGNVNIISVTDQICNSPVAGVAEVNVNAKPIADIGNQLIKICDSDFSTAISIFPINITESPDWELTLAINGNPLPMEIVAASPYNYNALAQGVYTVNTIKDDNCAGVGVGQVTIIDNPLPTATIVTPNNFCTGSAETMPINLIGRAPFTFDLFLDGVKTEYTNVFKYRIDYPIVQGGSYEIKNLSDKNCVSSLVFGPFNVTETPIPDAILSGGGSLCNGDPTSITIELTGTGPFTFVYAIDGINQPAITTPNDDDYNFQTSQLGVYTLVAVSSNGCEGTISGSAEVFPEPTATLSGTQDICTNETKYLDIVFTGNPNFVATILRNGVLPGSTITTPNNNYKFPVTNGGVYTISSFNDGSCVGTKTGVATLTAYQTAQASIYGGNLICENSFDTINIVLSGTPPYTFVYTENASFNFIVEEYSDNTYSFVTNHASTYRIPIIHNEKCFNSPNFNGSTRVSHIPIARASLIAADTICADEPHEFEVNWSGRGAVDLTYTFGVDTIVVDSILDSPYMIPSTFRGDYKLISVVDTLLCYSEEVFDLGRLTVHDLPVLQLSGDTFKCEYDFAPVVFDFVGTPPFSADLYRQANFLNTVEPIYTNHYALATKEPGKYGVIDFSDKYCSNITDETVRIDHYITPVVKFEGGGLFCDPDSLVTFFSTTVPEDTTSNFIWEFDDGDTIMFQDTVTRNFAENRCYDVKLIHETYDGCVFDTTMYDIVCIDHKPTANFIYEPEYPTIFTDYINLTNESENGADFTWIFNKGLNGTSDDFNTFYSSFNRLEGNLTEVCLKATSYLGCKDTLCKDIFIKDEFVHYVPSSFTPNNDGVNDFFAPVTHNADNYLFQLQIFDRAGKLIYESNEVSEPVWDGKHNGTNVKQDVYTWKLKIKDQSSNNSSLEFGFVTILF